MAVEKMSMMNIIGNISYVDNLVKDLIFSGKVNLVNALSQIEENSFVFNIKDENLEKAIDFNYISGFSKDKSFEELLEKGEELKQIFNIKPSLDISNDIELRSMSEISNDINEIYDKAKIEYDHLEGLRDELRQIGNFYSNFSLLKDFAIPIDDLRSLKHFNYSFGILSKEDKIKLKRNYENILATVLHTGSSDDGDVYLTIYPSSLSEEINRVLRSLNWREIQIPEEYKGKTVDIINSLDSKRQQLLQDINQVENELEHFKKQSGQSIESLVGLLYINEKIERSKEQMAKSNKFFYLSGWVSVKDKKHIDNILGKYDDILTIYKSQEETPHLKPPTKLRNIPLFRPFESLVKMYGIPAYNELDPTPFLSITYMLLFGAMFGDVGQGAVIFLGGILLSLKMANKMFGKLLSRLGVSSMIFGVLYGSFFGFENVIPALLIKPFENINTILISAILNGILLLLISYIYGMINCYKRKDIEEGVFGKEGLAGFLLYISLLAMGGGYILKKTLIPTWLGIIIVILSILGMIFRQPLTHLIQGKRPLHGEDISGYYIEGSFMIMETLLSILSGTVSFIRVGAFAISHVGLFLAFETMAHMIGTPVGSAIVLTLGNVLVIALDGLIVFIQGLRLQYYELFSRYYKGDGIEFKPMNINN